MTKHIVWLYRDDGTRLARLSPISFTWTHAQNTVGHFSLSLPGGFDRSLLDYDRRIGIWRKPEGGAQYLEFAGLVRRIQTRTDVRGLTTFNVSGCDLNGFLARRVVAYSAGSPESEMTDQADDLITEIVKDNLGSDAIAARQISSTYFSVASSPAAGPSITKGFSYRNVLEVLRDVSDAARQAGTALFFGIKPTGESTFGFSTRTQEWGRDRTADDATRLIFSLVRGNLANPVLDEDAGDEVNFAYGLGQGEGSLRNVQTSEDTARSAASLFARSEAAISATGEATDAGVADVADARVMQGRPVRLFSADLLSVPGSRYGLDWGFGDKVPISYAGLQFDVWIRAITVSVDENGRETISGTVLELT